MPHRYPRPPIDLAGLFLPPPAPEPTLVPAWWPNDKHRVLTFQAPALLLAADSEDPS